MTDPNLIGLAAVRDAMDTLLGQAADALPPLYDSGYSREDVVSMMREAMAKEPEETAGYQFDNRRARRGYPEPAAERHIEDLAREWCAATGINPDASVTFGEMPPVPGTPDAKFMTGTVRPAWTQFIDQAYKFAQAVGIPVRKADKPGGYPLWISPESVTEFRAVPMARDDSSI